MFYGEVFESTNNEQHFFKNNTAELKFTLGGADGTLKFLPLDLVDRFLSMYRIVGKSVNI